MEHTEFNKDLIEFLNASPTPWHAVNTMKTRLEAAGFQPLDEREEWSLQPGQGYYVTRNGSSIVAFRTGTKDVVSSGIRMVGAHTDSPPCLKVKPNPEIRRKGFLQLGVEVYGGGVLLNPPWFDRDLSLAGRVTVLDDNGKVRDTLVNFRKPVAIIPSLAIHLDREANSSRTVNAQTDLPPVVMQVPETDTTTFAELLKQQIAKESGLQTSKILGYELSFYDAQGAALVGGLREEFLASARLDNLLSCYIACRPCWKPLVTSRHYWSAMTMRKWAVCPPKVPRGGRFSRRCWTAGVAPGKAVPLLVP